MHDYWCLVSDKIQEVIMLSPIIRHCLDEYNLIQQWKDAVVNSPILTEKSRYFKQVFFSVSVFMAFLCS